MAETVLTAPQTHKRPHAVIALAFTPDGRTVYRDLFSKIMLIITNISYVSQVDRLSGAGDGRLGRRHLRLAQPRHHTRHFQRAQGKIFYCTGAFIGPDCNTGCRDCADRHV